MRMTLRRRVPVVMQLADTECGAACLAMILGYHRRHVPLGELRTDCQAGRDGLTAGTILRAAEKQGLQARARSLEPHLIKPADFPLIAHWGFSHYVVVERLEGRG